MYSIQKYVLRIMKEKRISKKELAKRLGYQNISKGKASQVYSISKLWLWR